jgi:hypothetical protein
VGAGAREGARERAHSPQRPGCPQPNQAVEWTGHTPGVFPMRGWWRVARRSPQALDEPRGAGMVCPGPLKQGGKRFHSGYGGRHHGAPNPARDLRRELSRVRTHPCPAHPRPPSGAPSCSAGPRPSGGISKPVPTATWRASGITRVGTGRVPNVRTARRSADWLSSRCGCSPVITITCSSLCPRTSTRCGWPMCRSCARSCFRRCGTHCAPCWRPPKYKQTNALG